MVTTPGMSNLWFHPRLFLPLSAFIKSPFILFLFSKGSKHAGFCSETKQCLTHTVGILFFNLTGASNQAPPDSSESEKKVKWCHQPWPKFRGATAKFPFVCDNDKHWPFLQLLLLNHGQGPQAGSRAQWNSHAWPPSLAH